MLPVFLPESRSPPPAAGTPVSASLLGEAKISSSGGPGSGEGAVRWAQLWPLRPSHTHSSELCYTRAVEQDLMEERAAARTRSPNLARSTVRTATAAPPASCKAGQRATWGGVGRSSGSSSNIHASHSHRDPAQVGPQLREGQTRTSPARPLAAALPPVSSVPNWVTTANLASHQARHPPYAPEVTGQEGRALPSRLLRGQHSSQRTPGLRDSLSYTQAHGRAQLHACTTLPATGLWPPCRNASPPPSPGRRRRNRVRLAT